MTIIKNKGFTLIELMVVMAIIAVITTIGLVSYRDVQKRTRDAQRKQDIRALGQSLEIYYQKNSQYIGGVGTNCSTDTPGFYTNIASFMNQGNVPKDPLNQAQYCYISVGNGQSYRLFATLEDPTDADGITCSSFRYYTQVSEDLSSSCPP